MFNYLTGFELTGQGLEDAHDYPVEQGPLTLDTDLKPFEETN